MTINTPVTQALATAKAVIAAPKRATDLTHRDLSWFSERIARGQKEVFLEIVTITPDIARRILERNPDNRGISGPLIRDLVADIKHGRWALNGETIIVSKDGYLNDGQHRLLAVIEAGEPIQSAMMFGVDRKTRTTVDMGRARSARDFLGMQGVVNANVASAIAKLWLSYSQNIYNGDSATRRTTAVTRQDVIRFYRENQAEVDAATLLARSNKVYNYVGAAAIGAASAILHKQYGHESAPFFAKLESGANLDPGSPILYLRQRMMTMTPERLRPWQKLEIILRYWNAFREEKPLTRHLPLQGAYPTLAK